MTDKSTVRPIENRIVALDVLRGFALFGVLMVNMLDFSSSALRASTLGMRGDELDQLIDLAIAFFAVVKFYLLFSFLFGIGFAVQMRRMEASNRPFVGFYLRRLFVLFLIGFAHSILLWDGDILRLYAVAGVLLLLVRGLSTRILLGLAGAIALGGLIIFSLADPSQLSDMTGIEAIPLYMNGTYGELVSYRLNMGHVLDIQIPMVLVMFLLGLVVGRSGVLDDPARYAPFLRRWWKFALPVGLIGNLMLLIGFQEMQSWMVSVGLHVGAPALSFVYVTFVLLNAEKLRALAPVGQMALTNYLSHSLICTTLFYGYGFGLYDQLAPTVTFLLVFVIFGAQMVISRWWMSQYRFGLMEWVWRSLTYWQIQPLRRKPSATANESA
ncbi:MAG: DUF418 domain-containing protein [Anaerolineae bacterium]|jgi:uncharacterized protein|nr:DUF418 domain-containing protein [Anaerolineae bacterium]